MTPPASATEPVPAAPRAERQRPSWALIALVAGLLGLALLPVIHQLGRGAGSQPVAVPATIPAASRASLTPTPATTPPAPADTQPPHAPTGLRLVSSAWDSFSLGWEAAVDDTGTVRYLVALDGEVVETTDQLTAIVPWPATGDKVLVQVSAVDSAGNQSEWATVWALTPTAGAVGGAAAPSGAPANPRVPEAPRQTAPSPRPPPAETRRPRQPALPAPGRPHQPAPDRPGVSTTSPPQSTPPPSPPSTTPPTTDASPSDPTIKPEPGCPEGPDTCPVLPPPVTTETPTLSAPVVEPSPEGPRGPEGKPDGADSTRPAPAPSPAAGPTTERRS